MTKFMSGKCGAFQRCFAAGIAALLVACGGGGGGAGTPLVGPGSGTSTPGAGSAVADDLVVVLSKSTLVNSGTDSITATVTSIDANRAAIGGVPVSVSVDANAVVTTNNVVATDAKGVFTATITQGSDPSARPVTLTVKSGAVTRTVSFNVVQNPAPTTPQVARLTLTLNAFTVPNSGSTEVVATAAAIGSNQNALSGIPIQLSVTDGDPIQSGSPSSFMIPGATQTGANGQLARTVNIGGDHSNRTVTVTATSGALVATAAFEVTGAQFAQASPVPSVVTAGQPGKVLYTLADVNGNPMRNIPISVNGGGVATQSGFTDLNGGFSFNYTAPNTPGATLQFTAKAGGVESKVNVTVAGGATTVPNALAPVSKTLNLSSNVVSVNTATSSNQVSVSAIFRDGSNAPINNVRVLFDATGDNGTGAIASTDYTKTPSVNNPVLSDASGTASTAYKPGSVSSPTNGVTVRACWKISDFVAGETVANCPAGNLLTTTLTIVSNPVSISIGTDNALAIGPSALTYVKKYVVLVVDSAGNPKADVQITPSLDLAGYSKGFWTYNAVSKKWERKPQGDYLTVLGDQAQSSGALNAVCPNEDLNRNGVIDSGEDVNGNGQLDSRKSDVAITLVGATKTDANGVAVLQLEYPKSLGSWVNFKITVTAAGVLSPPAYFPSGIPVSLPSAGFSLLRSQADKKALTTPGWMYAAEVLDYLYTYALLPVPAGDLGSEADPPFKISPYGSDLSCTSSK